MNFITRQCASAWFRLVRLPSPSFQSFKLQTKPYYWILVRKVVKAAWIGFVFVCPLKTNFHHSKLFEISSLDWHGMWFSLVDENKYECGWERNTINSCWGAAPQIKHRITGCGKTTKYSSFWLFFEQFSPQTSNLYIKNAYFANKIGSDTLSWVEEGLKHFGQSQGGLPPPTQLTNTENTMSNTSRLSRAIY